MPSTATITSFHTFVQNTKARASQVNTNFMNYRGHIVPINTDTVSCSDLTHDLGSDEHRWRVGYVRDIDFETSTSTASLVLTGDTSDTTGAFVFKIEGVEKARIDAGGLSLASLRGEALTVLTTTAFTSNGTWTAPSSTTWAIVSGYGGGGAGGGSQGAVTSPGGGGGGQGCATNSVVVIVTPGSAYSITVGAGGTAPGGNGGDTIFGALVRFQGGEGGKIGIDANTGATNTSSGVIEYAARGGDRSMIGNYCRGGWGSIGAAGNGENMSNVYSIGGTVGGTGGTGNGSKGGGVGGGAGGGGNGGAGGAVGSNPAGSASAISGGGGGGAHGDNGTAGNGGSGYLMVSYVKHS